MGFFVWNENIDSGVRGKGGSIGAKTGRRSAQAHQAGTVVIPGPFASDVTNSFRPIGSFVASLCRTATKCATTKDPVDH